MKKILKRDVEYYIYSNAEVNIVSRDSNDELDERALVLIRRKKSLINKRRNR